MNRRAKTYQDRELIISYLQKYLFDDAIDCLQFPIDDTIHFQLMVRQDAMMALIFNGRLFTLLNKGVVGDIAILIFHG